MTAETRQLLLKAGREDLIAIEAINESGYAGVLSSGNIVDRRLFPDAIPVRENKMFGIPAPKPVESIIK